MTCLLNKKEPLTMRLALLSNLCHVPLGSALRVLNTVKKDSQNKRIQGLAEKLTLDLKGSS